MVRIRQLESLALQNFECPVGHYIIDAQGGRYVGKCAAQARAAFDKSVFTVAPDLEIGIAIGHIVKVATNYFYLRSQLIIITLSSDLDHKMLSFFKRDS